MLSCSTAPAPTPTRMHCRYNSSAIAEFGIPFNFNWMDLHYMANAEQRDSPACVVLGLCWIDI